MSNLVARLKLLVTGKSEWLDAETGEVVDTRTETWDVRWALAGVHSHNWWWVRKWGSQECGCTINPLTRRRLLFNMACAEHCEWAQDIDPEWVEK